MADTPADAGFDTGIISRLARTRFMTRSVMVVERAWPLVLPILLVIGLFLSLSWFGLFRIVPEWLRLGLVGLFGLAALGALLPLRAFRMPAEAEIDRRIESANRLQHTPLLVQTDRPGGNPDGFADALWREHQRRMAARLAGVSADAPRPNIPERDPWAVRAAIALVFVVALAFTASPYSGSVTDAFRPASMRETVPPRIDAWVTPPAYTGRAPVFLTGGNEAGGENPGAGHFQVPENSQLALRVTGGSGKETLDLVDAEGNARDVPAEKAEDGEKAERSDAAGAPAAKISRFAVALTKNGAISLKSDGDEMRRWTFEIIPDHPPVIHFTAEPKHAANGALELSYSIEDDYGPASAKAVFEPAEKRAPGAHPLYSAPDMPLTLPRRDAKNHAAKTTKDLTDHPWAGTMVRLTLKAKDDAGHEASSETKLVELPERPFTNPLARALVEQRRILALDANKKRRVLDMMDAITLRPEDTFTNMGHYLAIMSARTRLQMASTDDQLRDVAAYLWTIALGIEEGNLSAAEKRLRQAEQALQQALKNGASDQQIEKLMKELRQAMQDYLREFAERMQKNPNLAQQMPQNGREIRPGDLQRMLDQIENLAKSGSRDKAQELLSQLQDMMNNLQAGRPGQQGGEQQGEMRQQMDKLGELMRRQQELMNKTFRFQQGQQGQRGEGEMGEMGQDQDPFGEQGQEGQQGQGGMQQGEQGGSGGMTEDELAQALKQLQQGQGKLRGDLGDLTKKLDELGIKPGKGFGDADKSMGQAGQSLGKGEGERALGEQSEALEALRRGARDMMQKMQQAQQGEEGGTQPGGRQQNADRDPLGRPRATTGPDFGDSVKVPDEIDVQRARRILEAIRKRLGNALSPEVERSYLERLLQFK
ncbi:MAG: TIGR02302 family protein [Rhizobiaceae bacterium]